MTNHIAHDRLVPGTSLNCERTRRHPRPPQVQLHQWLTPDLGHAKLREHLVYGEPRREFVLKYSHIFNVF